MTWKNKGNFVPYPEWAKRGPWVEKKCFVCSTPLGGAVPKAFAEELMCFECPEPNVSDPQCNIPKEESCQ